MTEAKAGFHVVFQGPVDLSQEGGQDLEPRTGKEFQVSLLFGHLLVDDQEA